ncbi:MAG: hypothetical protein R3E48_04980 [Burkholderiaceae bacterium]
MVVRTAHQGACPGGAGPQGRAIRYAEASVDDHADRALVARTCEEILLSSGLADEAYARYGLEAHRAGTYLAWFRAVAKTYPHKQPDAILADLVAHTPGEEGKWFAAAKDAGQFETAAALALRSPCAPQTLARAARDFAQERPGFAIDAGFAALHWLLQGYGYEVTSTDVLEAYEHTMTAAANAGRSDEMQERVGALLAGSGRQAEFVREVLALRLKARG